MSSTARARRWGYHQLDGRVAARVVRDAAIQPGELVLDVGAGSGALTAPLVDSGARVLAIELHPQRLVDLRSRFAETPVTVIRADAASLRLPRRPFRVVANPPFAITTQLFRRLLAPGSRLLAADLIVPRPVLHRWMAPNAPGARRWRRQFLLDAGRRIPAGAFHPRAPMDCVVLQIRRR